MPNATAGTYPANSAVPRVEIVAETSGRLGYRLRTSQSVFATGRQLWQAQPLRVWSLGSCSAQIGSNGHIASASSACPAIAPKPGPHREQPAECFLRVGAGGVDQQAEARLAIIGDRVKPLLERGGGIAECERDLVHRRMRVAVDRGIADAREA